MKEYVVGRKLANSLKRKNPAKPKEVTATIRKSFNDAPSVTSASTGTLDHASAAGAVQRIRAVIRLERM